MIPHGLDRRRNTGDAVFGIPVHVSRMLPLVPSDGENARRIVRNGMKQALPWLRIDALPEPGEECHSLSTPTGVYVSASLYRRLHDYADGLVPDTPGDVDRVMKDAHEARHRALFEDRPRYPWERAW